VRLELELPGEVGRGARIPITLRLTNRSDRPEDVVLQGRPPAFDVVVTDRQGRLRWRRLEGEVIPAVLQLRTLAPGEAIVLEAEWDRRDAGGEELPPGVYTVTGSVPSDPPMVFQAGPTSLRLLP
jgi:hypothetical protein